MRFFRDRDDASGDDKDRDGGSLRRSGGRCTWPVAGAFFVACIVGGVLAWQLPDWDSVVGGMLPDFEKYTDSPAAFTSFPSAFPSSLPTDPPKPFDECRDNGDGESDVENSTCCNGLVSNCDMRADEIMYAASHNAMSSAEDGFSGPNHFRNMESSLLRGYRAFLLDFCDCGAAGLQMCHTICAAGQRNPQEVLRHVLEFLKNFPRDVVVLIFQIGREVTGERPISVAKIDLIMKTVPGLIDLVYDHNGTEPWPTLRELIDDDRRLLVFHHGSNECTVQDTCSPGLHYYYEYAVDTPFSFRTATALENSDESCKYSLGRGDFANFYGVNHFVTRALPDENIARRINKREFLTERVEACEELTGKNVNFLAVDFWSLGQLPEVVQNFNRKRALEKNARGEEGTPL